MAKSLEEIRLLEERAASLSAEADEAEANHVSEGDVMTRCLPNLNTLRHKVFFAAPVCPSTGFPQTCEARRQ